MRVHDLVFAAVWMAGSLAAQNNYYLPHVTDGAVANGTLKTTLALANTGRSPANVTISLTNADASPRNLTLSTLGSGSTFNLQLAPGATRLFVSDGSGDGTVGAAVVTSDAALTVSQVLSNVDLGGSTLSESAGAAVSNDDLALEFMIPVDTTGAQNTGVSLYNPGSTAVDVTLQLLDASGQAAGSTVVTVPPQGQSARLLRGDIFPDLGDFQGTLDVAGAAKLAAGGYRLNAASPMYTLLPAVNRQSRRLRFFLPSISDGPTSFGTVQTSFLLTNLSSQTATVKAALTAADGTPLAVNIPGVDQNSNFTGSIPPGATVFWQTDGASQSLASGGASLRSDQPIAVTAVLTSKDSQGGFISETNQAPAPVGYQFEFPFDSTSSASAGASFFNLGPQAALLTLNLVDPDGNLVASTQLAPIAAGATTTGMVADFFPGVSQANGAIVASAGGPLDATISAAGLRQSAAGITLTTTPAVRYPWGGQGTPSTVTPVLDAARSVSASIPPGGGTLSLTDANGNKFTLTIPAGALLTSEPIKMTAISSATGVSGQGLIAGVQLEPDGLGLLNPALLKIDLASPAPKGTLPIGWRGAAPGVYVNPILRDPQTFTMILTHFSGAGAGGFDLTSELISIANQYDLFQSSVGYLVSQAHEEAVSGDTDSADADWARAMDIASLGFEQVIEPMMELATGSDDEDVMRCAATLAIGYLRQLELLGVPDDDPQKSAINDFLQYIMSRAAAKVSTRCKNHDITAYFDLIGVMRQAELMGTAPPDADPSSCPPALILEYTSNIKGDVPVGLTGTFDAVIKGKVTLTGNFDKEELTHVDDPSKDLYPSFKVSGSDDETYEKMDLKVNGVPSNCSVTVPTLTPDTMKVKPGEDPKLSRVKYKFNPHYDPRAVTANGQQLCSFCPVYRKEPVLVELWMDPGKPSEVARTTCNGVSQDLTTNFWWSGWAVNHATAGDNGFIQTWDLVNTPDLLAQKNISQVVVGPSATLTEKTDLKLKPAGAQ